MRQARIPASVVAVLLVASSAIGSENLPRAPAGGSSYQTTPCPQPNIAGVVEVADEIRVEVLISARASAP